MELVLAAAWIWSLSEKSAMNVREQVPVTLYETDHFISCNFLSAAKLKEHKE